MPLSPVSLLSSNFLRFALFALLIGCVGVSTADDRFPFVIKGDDVEPSVTSRNGLLESPAGKDGFVSIDNGHFAYGGKRIRFWGMNLCFSANFPSHDDADKIAPHLAKLGVNAVRFHHMDMQDAPGGIWSSQLQDGKRVLDDEMIDRLDYFLAKLHENGIYADLNLHVSRTLSQGEGFPKLENAPWWAGSNKWVMYYDRDVQNHLKQYCRDLLTHKNPYRDNLRRVDDPGIALVEMMNENYFSEQGYALYRRLPQRFQASLIDTWNRWLVGKYGDTATLKKQWYAKQPKMGAFLIAKSDWSSDLGKWGLSKGDGVLPRKFAVLGPRGPEQSKMKAIRLEPVESFEQDYQLQLAVSGLSVTKGQPLTLTYWVRADKDRQFHVELSSSKGGDWRDLGLYELMKATPQWKKFSHVIVPGESIQHGVGMQFSFGDSTTPIEFANVSLQQGAVANPLPESQTLESGSVGIPEDGFPAAAHSDMTDFMKETEVAWVEELKSFLKDDLGVKVPITASQINYHTSEVNENANDFIDLHNYWHHPMFPSGANWDPERWAVGNEPMEAKPQFSGWPANSLLMRSSWRYEGKPMTLSEWNYPEPSPFSSGCVPAAAVIAALQDWDAVFFFEYDSSSKTTDDWFRDQTVNFFSFNGQPVKLANFSVFANVFLRGDLPPLQNQVVAPVGQPVSGDYGLAYRLSVSPKVDQAPELPKLNSQPLSTPTGNLKWIADGDRDGFLQMNTTRTQGIWGTIRDKSAKTDDLKLSGISVPSVNYGTLVATSQTPDPIATSSSVLLLASTHSENNNMGWNQERDGVGTAWGEGPTTIVGLDATIELKTSKPIKVYALDGQGNRTQEVPVTQGATDQDGKAIARFQIAASFKTLWYEIVR